MVLKSEDLDAEFFVAGRMAMTCCADDTSFIGYVCRYQGLRLWRWAAGLKSLHLFTGNI